MALFFNSWILFGVLKALAEDGLDLIQGTLVSRCLIRTRPRNYFLQVAASAPRWTL